MATLDNADYTQIRQIIRGSEYWPTFKAWGLSKQNWYDLFQACETYHASAFLTTPTTSIKAALDAVVTTTNTQAKHIWLVWALWRSTRGDI